MKQGIDSWRAFDLEKLPPALEVDTRLLVFESLLEEFIGELASMLRRNKSEKALRPCFFLLICRRLRKANVARKHSQQRGPGPSFKRRSCRGSKNS